LYDLSLNNNEIISLSPLSKLIELEYLYLSGNRISDVNHLKDLNVLIELDISNNQISKIDDLKGLIILKRLNVSRNQIKNIEILSKLSQLTRVDMSFNDNLTSFFSISEMSEIEQVFLNLEIFKNIFDDKLINKRIAKQTIHDTHLKTLFVVTSDDLEYLECFETIDYLRRGVHLNLYYDKQVYRWIEECRPLDVDFSEILNHTHEKEISIFEVDLAHIYALISTIFTFLMFAFIVFTGFYFHFYYIFRK
jgi:hypothetical protein